MHLHFHYFSCIIENCLNLCNRRLMVEIAIFIKPLLCCFLVSRINHGSVNKLKIFSLALWLHEFMSFFEDWRVVLQNAKPVPSLFDFGVERIGEVVVVVNPLHDSWINLTIVFSKFVKEDELVLYIVVFECFEVVGRAGTFQLLILLREELRLLWIWRGEVDIDWQLSWPIYPTLPVKFAWNFLKLIRLSLECLILDENLKRIDKISGSCRAFIESFDVCSKELSHVFFTDEWFEVE